VRPGRPRLRPLIGAAAIAATLAVAGCGGDEDSTGTVTTPTTTAPLTTSSATTTTPDTTVTTPTAPTTTTAPPPTATTTGSEPDPARPDSEHNDTQGDPSTPEGAFDEACQRNPESCG